MRKWLKLHHDVPNANIHAPPKFGELGVHELKSLVPTLRKVRRVGSGSEE